MKKLYYTLLFVCATMFSVSAQTPEKLKLDEGAKLFGAVSVNSGLVLLTGKEYYYNPNLDWKVTQYWPDLTQRYQVKIDKPRYNYFLPAHLVVSPTGNNVYFIQGKGVGLFSSSAEAITYIDSMGVKQAFDLKGKFHYSSRNVAFADDNNLYIVTKTFKKERHKKGKTYPTLEFIRIAHDKSVSNVPIELPEPDPDATEWSYLGHTTEVSYFTSRLMEENNKEIFRIAVIDEDGKLLDDFKLTVALSNGEFRAGYNHSSAAGTWVIDNHNIKVTTSSYTSYNASTGTSSTHTSVTYSPNTEAYGDIMFDPMTNGFYIYGLSGPVYKKSKKLFARQVNTIASDFYVYKYDQDGNEVWNYNGKLAGIDDYFKSKATFYNRDIQLNPGFAGAVRFQAFARKNVFTYELNSETGKLNINYINTFDKPVTVVDLGSCHKPGDKSSLGKFLAKGDKGNYSQLNFRFTNSNVIVRNYFDDYRLELFNIGDE
jgi:hypothetical protein